MLIKRMVLTHLIDVCPNINAVLQPFADNSHYEMQYGVSPNGERVRSLQTASDDDGGKSCHLLSFPITACSILFFFSIFASYFQISFVSRLEFSPELVICAAAGPGCAGSGRSMFNDCTSIKTMIRKNIRLR